MVSSSSDFPQKSLQIKKDDKFFSRIVSKEGSSMANNNPSFRIYYGGVSGAVPFMWESQPGTPKHTLFSNTTLLPPLTPPPSYQFNSNKKPNKKHSSRSTLLHTLFPRLNSTNKQQSHVSPSSPSSLSLSSSWSSSTTSSMSVKKKRGRFSSSARSSFDSMMDEYEEEPSFDSSHTSTLCFGFGRETNNGGGGLRGGCSYSAMSMKKAFLSIVGQGSKLRY